MRQHAIERWISEIQSSPRNMRKQRGISLFLALFMVLVAPVFTNFQAENDHHPVLPSRALDDNDLVVVTTYEIDGLTRRPTCENSRANLEITNKDKAKPLIIYGVETHPTVNSTLQVYINKFQDRAIEIGPHSSILIPVTFVPKIPFTNKTKRSNDAQNSTKGLSKAALADLSDLIGSNTVDRNNRGDIHHVSTDLVLNTSHGIFRKTINASALTTNKFHLPHTISFYSDGYVTSGDELLEQKRLNFLDNKKHWEASSYEFDLYMDNPLKDQEIPLHDIYVSRPDLVSLSFHHNGKMRFNNCDTTYESSTNCNIPRGNEMAGPPVIKPATEKSYICTITLKQNPLRHKMQDMPLGYLQLVTPNVTLTVFLEYVNEKNDDTQIKVGKPNIQRNTHNSILVDTNSRVHIGRESARMMGRTGHFLQSRCDPKRQTSNLVQRTKPWQSSQRKKRSIRNGKFLPTPEFLDFGLLVSQGDEHTIGVSISNNDNIPVRLMRYKVSIDEYSEDFNMNSNGPMDVVFLSENNDSNPKYQISSYVVFGSEGGDKGQAIIQPGMGQAIQPGETKDNFVFITITQSGNNTRPLHYKGSVLLHFGSLDENYPDWENIIVNDPVRFHENLVEIPFQVTLMSGGVEYYVNETNFPMTNPLSIQTEVESNGLFSDSKCSKGFVRTLRLKNAFPINVRLVGVEILNDERNPSSFDCQKYFSIYDFEGSNFNTKYSNKSMAQPGEFWGGISLSYEYLPSHLHVNDIWASHQCFMLIETDKAGNHSIPLNIFSAKLEIETAPAIKPSECNKNNKGHLVKHYNDCLKSLKDSTIGKMIYSAMNTFYGQKNAKQTYSNDIMVKYINQYFSTLTEILTETKNDHNSIVPIVLSLGSMSSNSTGNYSIFLKNLNPIPVKINALSPAVEGLEIRLARTYTRIIDWIDNVDTQVQDDQFQSNEWLYNNSPENEIHKRRVDSTVISEKSDNDKDNKVPDMYMSPPEFSTFKCTSNGDNESIISPFIQVQDRICKLETRFSKTKFPSWTIPPGGMARFELLVKVPSKQAFQHSDVTDILTTGVILQTNFGEIFPVIISYRALSGRLQIVTSHDIESDSVLAECIEVVPVLRQNELGLHQGPKQIFTGKTFLIQNAFSSDVILRDVYSCSNFFQIHVEARSTSVDDNEPMLLRSGESVNTTVQAFINCANCTESPSFFHYALSWLQRLHLNFSENCNNVDHIHSQTDFQVRNRFDTDTDKAIVDTIKAFKSVISYFETRYRSTVIEAVDGRSQLSQSVVIADNNLHQNDFLSRDTEVVFQKALIQWKSICKLGLNIITGDIRAEFDLIGDDIQHHLNTSDPQSTTLDTSYFKTSLEIPRLFDRESLKNHAKSNLFSFGSVPISHTSEMYVPIKNPSGQSIKVHLITKNRDSESSWFLQSKATPKHNWWTGGSYYISDEKGALLLSTHNVTIETPTGSSLSIMNPSIQSSSAFLQGCSGRRCGNNLINKQPTEKQYVSPIGASSSVSSFLSGRHYSSSGDVEKIQYELIPDSIPPFALGWKSVKEVTVPPFGEAKLGPIYFRPPSRGQFKSKFFLENSLTGLEKVRVEGSGGWQKIIFLEANETENNIETRYNKPALMFKRSTDDSYHTLVRNVLIANAGDTTVKFTSIGLKDANFIGKVNSAPEEHNIAVFNQCKRRGFEILDCRLNQEMSQSNSTKPNVLDGFILKPKEARHLRLIYTFDCSFQSMYVSLVLNFRRHTDSSSHNEVAELLLGYELKSDDIAACLSNLDKSKVGRMMKKNTLGRNLLMLSSFLIPLFVLALVFIDTVCAVIRRRSLAATFRGKTQDEIMRYKNWTLSFRCLSKADPDASELASLGKEQTRQILLSRFRKDRMLQPQCILQNGTFSRERHLINGNANEANVKEASDVAKSTPTTARRGPGATGKTLSESIFSSYRSYSSSLSSSGKVGLVLPGGLDWKVATSRGIIKLHGLSRMSTKIDSKPKGNIIRQQIPEKVRKSECDHSPLRPVRLLSDTKKTEVVVQHKDSALTSSKIQGKQSNTHVTDKNNMIRIDSDKVSKKREKKPSIDLCEPKANPHPTKKFDSKSSMSTESSIVPPKALDSGKPNLFGKKLSQNSVTSSKALKVKLERNPDRSDQNMSFNSQSPPKKSQVIQKAKNDSMHVLLTKKAVSSPKSKETKSEPINEMVQSTCDDSSGLNQAALLKIDIPLGFDSDSNDGPMNIKQNSKFSPIGPRRNKPDSVINGNDTSDGTQEDGFSCPDDSASSMNKLLQRENNMLRPPPGLSPPPGFTSSDNLQVSLPDQRLTPSDILAAPSHVSELCLLEEKHRLLSNLLVRDDDPTPSEDKNADFAYQQSDVDGEEIPLVFGNEDVGYKRTNDNDDNSLLLGLGQDLNIMNFLSFLDEGVQHDESSREEGEAATLLENDLYRSNIYGTHPNAAVQPNPWSDAVIPRALAYGIEVEAENGKGHLNDDSRINNNMFTTSMVINQNDKVDIDGENDGTLLNLADLLNE